MVANDSTKQSSTTPAFGPRLRRLRIAADLTQEELASRASVSARVISDLERGLIVNPRRSTAHQLADALDLTGVDRAAFLDLARGRPASTTPHGWSAPIPYPATSLIGRESEAREVTALLRCGETRLLTLTGPGGVGKTRLAIDVALQICASFADGAVFVDLSSLRDHALVMPTIAHALGLSPREDEAHDSLLTRWITDKHLLVVLDNVEHLTPAASALAGLLAVCPRLTILATSREPLRLRAECEYSVGPLPIPGPSDTAHTGTLEQIPSVELFVRCAKRANRDFALTAENASAVARIVSRLDGLPLAIELAAARSNVLPPEALLSRLQHRLPLLTGGAEDLPPRQQAMRSTIDWSYQLLAPGEQRVFRLLSVFAGGFSLDAAEAVSSEQTGHPRDFFEELSALTGKCLVGMRPMPDGTPRFFMLETIREFGDEALEAAGEAMLARERHATWCLLLAERAERELIGPDQAAWFSRLDTEHDNFRAALKWAIEQGNGLFAARLGSALRRFWNLRGHSREGRQWLERALDIEPDLPPGVRAKALLALGVIAYREGDYERARVLEEAIVLYRELGDLEGIASALGNLGLVAQALGDTERAIRLGEESLDMFRTLRLENRIATQLENIGLAAFDLGDFGRAERLLQEALAVARASGNRQSVAFSLNNLARVAHASGDDDRARTLQEQGIALWRELGNRDGLAHSFENLSMIAMSQCQPVHAVRLFGAAESLRTAIGAPGRLIDRDTHAHMLAEAHAVLGDDEFHAARKAGRSLPLDQAIAYALDPPAPACPSGKAPEIR